MGCGRLVERPAPVEGEGAPASRLVAVRIEDPGLCGRYCAAAVEGVAIGPAPFVMRHRLRLAGIRPINNVVDVTNYVMWETGQPLHAFDLDRLRAGRGAAGPVIVVRRSREGEAITTLDGARRDLKAGTLLICDGEGPVALAGVMGGLHSEVTDATRRVLIEAAQFDRTSIRVTAIGQRLPSEASLRFGRAPAAGRRRRPRAPGAMVATPAALPPAFVDVHRARSRRSRCACRPRTGALARRWLRGGPAILGSSAARGRGGRGPRSRCLVGLTCRFRRSGRGDRAHHRLPPHLERADVRRVRSRRGRTRRWTPRQRADALVVAG
jgi:hypothetical protein